MRISAPLFIPAILAASVATANAQRMAFDPAAPCSDLLLTGDAGDKTLSVFWASGYLAKTDGKERTINQAHIDGLYGVLQQVCKQAPEMSFQQTVDRFAVAQLPKKPAAAPVKIQKPAAQVTPKTTPQTTAQQQPTPQAAPKVTAQQQPTPQAAPKVTPQQQPAPQAAPKVTAQQQPAPQAAPKAPPTPARAEQPSLDGRDLLQKFFDPNADRAALTMALKPTPEDIRTVYAEPLASDLIAMYDDMFKPGVAIGPKPEHSEIYSVETTTLKLRNRPAIRKKFPGGYEDVIPYLQGNNVIIRFKFVRAGETTGLAFDGLIFVNGHWVLMPKPWRAVKK